VVQVGQRTGVKMGRRSFSRLRKQNGWTLIEAMVVTSVIMILAGIAAPQYSLISRQMHTSAAATQLLGNLQFARIQSLRTGVPHYVSTGMGAGVAYQVQRSAAPPLVVSASDPVVRNIDLSVSMPNVEFSPNGAAAGPYGEEVAGGVPGQPLVFDARGLPTTTAAYYVRSSEGTFAYAISITGAGRSRIWRQTTGGWQ
jgi:Tfp pilus assembly protein FimT